MVVNGTRQEDPRFSAVSRERRAQNLLPVAWFTIIGACCFTAMLIDWNLWGMGMVATLMVAGFWAIGALIDKPHPKHIEGLHNWDEGTVFVPARQGHSGEGDPLRGK